MALCHVPVLVVNTKRVAFSVPADNQRLHPVAGTPCACGTGCLNLRGARAQRDAHSDTRGPPMKAARLHAARDVRIENVPNPVPGPGEVLVRVRAVAICPSD
jgi:hypothetical protein